MSTKSESLKDLRRIPGVGKSIAQDLYEIGIRSVDDLKEKDPQKLYDHSNKLVGAIQDRCLLYVFRCAVYFAKTKKPKPELLKWWNWKDKKEKIIFDAKRDNRGKGMPIKTFVKALKKTL